MSKKAVRDWCANNNINKTAFLDSLVRDGVLDKPDVSFRYSFAKGTDIPGVRRQGAYRFYLKGQSHLMYSANTRENVAPLKRNKGPETPPIEAYDEADGGES